MHKIRIKNVEEEDNGITIMQLSCLMNCRKVEARIYGKHFPMSSLELFMVDDIRQDNNLRKKRWKERLDCNSHFHI